MLDEILRIGSLVSNYLEKKPKFEITDVSMNLTPRDRREPCLNVKFKVWNGRTRLKRIRTTDAISVNIKAMLLTDEGEAIEASTSNEPAGTIPVGRFHLSEHIMSLPKNVDVVWVNVKCDKATLTKNLKLKDYLE